MRNIADNPLALVLIIGLFAVLFGGKRLPEAARGLGRSMRIFKSEVKQMHDDDKTAKPATPPVEGRVVDDANAAPTVTNPTAAGPTVTSPGVPTPGVDAVAGEPLHQPRDARS